MSELIRELGLQDQPAIAIARGTNKYYLEVHGLISPSQKNISILTIKAAQGG
jgi:hypothetical protein